MSFFQNKRGIIIFRQHLVFLFMVGYVRAAASALATVPRPCPSTHTRCCRWAKSKQEMSARIDPKIKIDFYLKSRKKRTKPAKAYS